MKRTEDRGGTDAGLTPQGLFVVQLRSDSDLPKRHVRGRVEHVMSGQSVRFASLRELLAFMNRYATPAPAPTSTDRKKEDLSET